MYQTIICSTDGPITTLKLNRPEKLNAFGGPMRDEIAAALEAIRSDNRIRVLVITGEGRAFSAGGDIQYLKHLRETHDETAFRGLLEAGQSIARMLRSLPVPVVAAVNGACAGAGFSLALACDLRIAAETATFSPSFARIGLNPDWGGSWFLPRLVGTARACELILTASTINARDAERIGLVNAVVQESELIRSVMELAGAMVEKPRDVLRLAKENIYRSLTSDLQTAFARETEAQMECFRSEDFLEGVTAFIEKRKPQFKGL